MTITRHRPKIDPARRPARAARGARTVAASGNPAHAEWAAAGLDAPDMDVVRVWRLGRLRAELAARDLAGGLLCDPMNIRYATDASNMQVWSLHNPVRYAFVATEGPVVLFDFHGSAHLSADSALIDETRPATCWFYFEAGPKEEERARRWAAEIAELVRAHGGGNWRLAVDKADRAGIAALEAEGIEVVASQAFTEEARRIKHPEEIKALARAVHTAEVGMAEMWQALQPGITENRLWSVLHQANIARGGEWIETRLLASGPRTNPWFHECSDRIIEAGDVVAFDTDLIGPYGYCADISRAWVAPGARPSNEQTWLHATAAEQLAWNIELIRPGMDFREFAEKSFVLPEDCLANRYSTIVHGVGLCDEYPSVGYVEDWEAAGYDGVFEAGMCLCFESYVGRAGGAEGVKLERQGLLTETGVTLLDTFPTDLVPF